MSEIDSSSGLAHRDGLARRKRNAWLLGGAGGVSVVAATWISVGLGYDRLAEGTVGGSVTTVLGVAAIVLVTWGVILGVRARTPHHGITPWRRVGSATVIVWLGVAVLWGVGIVIGRAFPVTGPGVVLVVVVLSTLALPLVLWLPVWTLLSALRSPGRVKSGAAPTMEEKADALASVSLEALSGQADGYEPKPLAPVTMGSKRPTGLLVALGASLVVIVVLVAAVAFLLGRQGVSEPSAAPTSNVPSVASPAPSGASSTPAESSPTVMSPSPQEMEGFAWAVAGCIGSPVALEEAVRGGMLPAFPDFTWEPIYHEVATSLGVPDLEIDREVYWQSYNFRSAAFAMALSADSEWASLYDIWSEAGAYAYEVSRQVAVSGQPRGFAFEEVAARYGPRLESGCSAVVEGGLMAADAEGLELNVWIEKYAPNVTKVYSNLLKTPT